MAEVVGKQADALKIVNSHMGWSTGAGLIPIPLADLAAITAVQIHLVKSLSELYDVSFKRSAVKSIIGALVGGGSACIAAGPISSLVKVVPLVGQIAGILVEPAIAAASTYAVGKVFIQHFESGGTFLDFDPAAVREYYRAEFEANKGQSPSHA
jgi:uncharacterized protein (DUF697 family)